MQIAFIALLQAGLADVIRTAIICHQITVLKLAYIAIVYPPDITDHMGSIFAERIIAKQSRLDLDTRKTILLRGKAGDFDIAQVTADHQCFKIVALGELFFETPAILVGDLYQRRQIVYRGFDIRRFVRVYLQRVTGIVARQHHAIAVDDQAAVGNDRNDGDAVAFRQRLVITVAHPLEIDETHQQDRQQHQHKTDAEEQTQLEVKYLALMVFKLNALLHGLLRSSLCCRIARNMTLSGIQSKVEVTQPSK